MESNTCPQNCEGFPYFPPPWISPNSISSNDNSTPWWAISRWVIIGIVIVVVVAAVYYSFRSYNRHRHKDTTAASPILEIAFAKQGGTIHRWKDDDETSEVTNDTRWPSTPITSIPSEASTSTGKETLATSKSSTYS